MAKFSVYARAVLVGHSMLEHGDPPMGVAFGVFMPADAYSQIRRECTTNHADQSALELSVQTESGMVIPCAGVGVLDYSAEIDPPYVEVNVLGVPYPLYSELFPDHVARYDKQFGETPPCGSVERGGA
jgi:hypothetical protein